MIFGLLYKIFIMSAKVICHDRFYIIEYHCAGVSFVGSAYFDTPESAVKFGKKFLALRPGSQFNIKPIYFMPAENI